NQLVAFAIIALTFNDSQPADHHSFTHEACAGVLEETIWQKKVRWLETGTPKHVRGLLVVSRVGSLRDDGCLCRLRRHLFGLRKPRGGTSCSSDRKAPRRLLRLRMRDRTVPTADSHPSPQFPTQNDRRQRP